MHAMRAVSIIAVLLLLVANALQLLPVASPFEPYLSGGALVLGLVALVTILAGRVPERDTRAAAEAARPMPVPTGANYQADAEIVSFLATLQAKVRIVDFLMDDINAHDEAQVGADARVVLAGMSLPPNYGSAFIQKFEAMYKDLAAKYRVTLIPFLLEGVGAHNEFMQRDGIHPNAAGARKVETLVMKALTPLLK